nr:TetR/AcrR family transcriptional regulator [Sphaerochaetaceae bacterium]
MARDKKETLKKIVSAARSEFQKTGFEKASIRKIASDAGLTSAALYRHFSSKEEIFSYLVDPGIKAMRQWMEMHEKTSYEMIDLGNIDEAKSESSIDMIKEVVFPHLDAFKLLLCSAQGTKYENFIHETVEEHQKGLRRGLEYLKDKGYPVMDISDETLHM